MAVEMKNYCFRSPKKEKALFLSTETICLVTKSKFKAYLASENEDLNIGTISLLELAVLPV